MTIDTLICVHSTTNQNDNFLLDAARSIIYGSVKPNNLIIVYDNCWLHTQHSFEDLFDDYDLGNIKYIPVTKSIKQGLAIAKNFGLKFCTSDWITYVDADDSWMNSKLEVQIDYQIKNNLDFISTECWDRYGTILKPSYYRCGQYESHDSIKNCLSKGENPLVHGSMMIRRTALENLGGYQDVKGREDMDLWIRAINSGYKFGKIPERLYIYGMGTSVAR